jgi:predicted nucleic acid-binding protein
MADVLVDTDVLIDHLRGHRAFEPGSDRVFCSVITRAELFGGTGTDEEAVRRLLAPLIEIPIDRDLAEEAGRLRRTTGIALPDAVIAATARSLRVPLLTRNKRDFGRVRGLRVRAPR